MLRTLRQLPRLILNTLFIKGHNVQYSGKAYLNAAVERRPDL